MAMYEENTTSVTQALQTSSSQVFSDNTINTILALSSATPNVPPTNLVIDTGVLDTTGNVTFDTGTDIGFVNAAAVNTPLILGSVNVPSIILGGAGSFNVIINVPVPAGNIAAPGADLPATAEGTADRVVVHSAGADSFTINDGKNTLLVVGDKDTVVAGNGFDTVVAAQGHSTITGGSNGNTQVQAAGNADDYVVTVANGHAVVVNNTNGIGFDVTKVQYVKVDDGALIFAEDSKEASIATLYETVFGREADANGLKFWFTQSDAGLSLTQIAQGFLDSAEYKALPVADDTTFVQSLYQNTFNRAADADGLVFWTTALSNGTSRASVADGFAHAAAENLAGNIQTEAVLVGSITIVDGIV